MNKKILLLVGIIFLVSMTAVGASENVSSDVLSATSDDTLEKTYWYDADTDEEYEDDTVITHNVVKYYGDTDTKFKVKVYDEDYYPAEGVYVSFGKQFESQREKVTNRNGIVYFPINYKVGTHNVETHIDADDGASYWSAYNTVKIKSTIPVKELVKYSTSEKKFKIKFLDTKGHALKGKTVKVGINGKIYKLKTNTKGIVKVKSTLFKRLESTR